MKWTAALASSICILGLGAAVTAYGCSTADNPAQNGDTPNKVIGPQTGPCAPEGLTEPCHAITGQTQGIYNCYAGTQTCSNGTWGACVPGSSTRTILGKPTAPGATGPGLTADLVIPPPSPDASACANDTCDPYCIGFDQGDAGVLVDAAGISGEISGSYSGLPGGKQQNNNNCHGATNSGGNVATFPGGYTEPGCQFNASDPVQSSIGGSCNDCSMADECCNCTGSGCGACVPWATSTLGVGTCAPPPGCTLPDFTLGVGCLLPNGDVGFPVCNRGNAIANSGLLRLGLNNGNPGGNHSCLNGSCNDNEGFGFCDIDLATNPILVQACIEVDLDNPGPGVTCSGINDNPTESAFINENGTEVGPICTPTVAECDYCNNWSAKGPDNTQTCAPLTTPPPQSQTFTYQASCPDGSHPFWNQLAFNVLNLGLATVTFSATFQGILPDGGLGAPTASFTLAATPPLPADCPMSGPSPCPVNLDGADGGAGVLPLPAETDEVMNLTVTTQLAALPAPTIGFWQLSYDCVPTE